LSLIFENQNFQTILLKVLLFLKLPKIAQSFAFSKIPKKMLSVVEPNSILNPLGPWPWAQPKAQRENDQGRSI
jgi:hypothetical protein